jgi:periplasmic protein TonB
MNTKDNNRSSSSYPRKYIMAGVLIWAMIVVNALHMNTLDDTFASGREATMLQGATPIGLMAQLYHDSALRADTDTTVFSFVDEYPEFPGGPDSLRAFISSTTIYPRTAADAGIQGQVALRIIISEEGRILNPVVLRGLGSGLDEEAVRIVSNMPRWDPGRINGVPVRVQIILPIMFSLAEDAN